MKICDWLKKGSEIPIQVGQYTETIRSFLSGAGMQAEEEQICNVLEAFRRETEQSAAKHRGLLEDPEFFYHSYQDWKNESLTAFCPGLNYHGKGVVLPQPGRQMWFRIEVSDDGHLVAGFCLMNVENREKVDTAALTANEMKDLRRFLDPLIILPNNWWIVWRFSNGKQDASRDDVPNFNAMNRCAMHLLDEEKRTKFAQEAFQIFEDQLLGYLKPFSERSCD